MINEAMNQEPAYRGRAPMRALTRAALAAAAVVLVMLAILAVPAAAGAQVPFKGSWASVETDTVVVFPNLHVDLKGSGNATHLGRFTEVGEFFVNLLSGHGCGTEVLTAANGDTVNAAGCGQATPTAPPGVFSIEEDMVITGGTGRFAGATGSFARVRVVDAFGSSTGSIEGTLSSPGASKH
jgi:hypothetical protein